MGVQHVGSRAATNSCSVSPERSECAVAVQRGFAPGRTACCQVHARCTLCLPGHCISDAEVPWLHCNNCWRHLSPGYAASTCGTCQGQEDLQVLNGMARFCILAPQFCSLAGVSVGAARFGHAGSSCIADVASWVRQLRLGLLQHHAYNPCQVECLHVACVWDACSTAGVKQGTG